MRINSIKIENLFDIFHYDISFKENENVLLITGPNGYGKTMILNIIFSLFNRKFHFFQKLVFDEITLCLDGNIKIVIQKTFISKIKKKNQENNEDERPEITFLIHQEEKLIEKLSYHQKLENIERAIDIYLPVHKIGPNRWFNFRTDDVLTTEQVLIEHGEELPDKISENFLKFRTKKANDILDSIQVHLIKEQRLLLKTQAETIEKRFKGDKEQSLMTDAIQTYAEDLKQLIEEASQKSFIRTQELDSSYPKRLTNENNIFSKEEYKSKYQILDTKQKRLKKFGLYESKQEFLTYNNADAKALSVYLKDFEQKLGVFDELLEKLELFTNILNERRFTFKSIKVNRTKGFYFETSKGKELELNQLSSGEQHEVVLLYELIFNVKPNVLVLIDEPEISLHITWQKEFLSDLLKITKIQKIQVLIATHSPSIINDRWDLVYNLEAVKNQ